MRFSVYDSALPRGDSFLESFRLAAEAGFEGLEVGFRTNPDRVAEVGEAAERTGLSLHTVHVRTHWTHPLSSSDPRVAGRSIDDTHTALENARRWGAGAVLVVPGLVSSEVSYLEAYRRSQQVIREELLPAARELGILLVIENVWNGFLLSPLEFVRYVDELDSPSARALLDIGNMFAGHPEHWIPILGSRIAGIHAKDFAMQVRLGTFAWRKLGRGAIRWDRVRAELDEIGFTGWVSSVEPFSLFTRGIRVAARELGEPMRAAPHWSRRALWALKRRRALQVLRAQRARCERFLGERRAPVLTCAPSPTSQQR